MTTATELAERLRGRVAPPGQQIVTRGQMQGEAVGAGELATAFAEAKTDNAVSDIARAIAGQVGATVDDIRARVEAMLGGIAANSTTIVEHTEAIAELASIAAAGTAITPAYVSNLDEMATVPRRDCVDWVKNGENIDRVIGRFTPSVQGQISGVGGVVYYVPLPVDRDGIPNRLRFVSRKDGSWAVDDIADHRVDLCVLNPETQAIEKVTDNGNLRDLGAAQDSELTVPLSLGENNRVKPGQLLFIAHQQRAPGFAQGPRWVMAAPNPNISRAAGVLPRYAMYRTTGFMSAIPSSIPIADLTGLNDWIMWFAVGMT
ncbi:minor tail protein [Gordonia phage Catfish]|uniref:Minor tail protein n=1 Tax=Gordonia phage Catfish TaxID=2301538 RepID=A0A385D0L2_9CAUD|nr:minor tail protein [Gordonia phage Catfish]AXQ51866.1 hypothetical protein SEA_CATFISH_29 [Gordonia phage Catfish]